ncbi:hypothetical protein P153DRAFT_429989 [Dothidotthia symphoricarpi CBS 119687]|uniref:Uncharacterized protein n=1 Tax=Dothidotthia symphoricarpi CBS 119687 TaxID=1392245 RepID=A0A6A6AKK3_9PLEO|nr:uncharacterized protein P153DRAFT_429989 [Dothidotthia symphoricarpi CBS 119687]KAF2131763.1 hypothetical protein P153DRAFT_429989 [Dothidotthia symphoricarpi CBS 119687]
MKFLVLSTIIGAATATNLLLWKQANACSGSGAVCVNAGQRVCCYQPGQLWGSAQAVGGGAGDVAGPWTKQGDSYCGIQIRPTRPIPICFVTNLEQSLGGITWEHQARRSMERSAPLTPVEADEMYSDGVHMYVITKGKMARMRSSKPTGENELLEFFKTHADMVINQETGVPVSKVDASNASE